MDLPADEVGFANLPNCLPLQKHAFTVMAVGESGVGKSTFLNALFESGIFSSTGASALHDSGGGGSTDTTTTTVQRSTVELIENGVTLDLTVVDTPGFAAAVNNQDCWTAITDDIDKAFEGYMAAESKVLRSPVVQDDRVHCCLYFINPTGHGLKPLDAVVMQKLHNKVNLIPVIGKADLLTSIELAAFKSRIKEEIERNGIQLYTFPNSIDPDESASETSQVLPFAVSCSRTANGASEKIRQYPWGTIKVADPHQSDFILLRNLLIGTHTLDMVNVTHDTHYEHFRNETLSAVASPRIGVATQGIASPMAQFESQKQRFEQATAQKEDDMSASFRTLVREQEQQMKDMESHLLAQHDTLEQKLKTKQRDLERKRKEFQLEKEAYIAARTKKTGSKGSLFK